MPDTDVKIPFTPGRMDASQEQTDVQSFDRSNQKQTVSATIFVDKSGCRRRRCWSIKAQLLKLTAPEMTVLVGGMRVLGANTGNLSMASSLSKPGTLTNDFFVNLLDMRTDGSRRRNPMVPVQYMKDAIARRIR